MKTIKITSMLVALLVGGAAIELTAGEPVSNNTRDCVRQMNANFRECAQGQQPESIEKKSPLRRTADTKSKTEDAQGFEGSCRMYAWWDFMSCSEEIWDGVEKPSTKKGSNVISTPAPAAK